MEQKIKQDIRIGENIRMKDDYIQKNRRHKSCLRSTKQFISWKSAQQNASCTVPKLGSKWGQLKLKRIPVFLKKARKTPDFLSKSGVFMAKVWKVDTMHCFIGNAP